MWSLILWWLVYIYGWAVRGSTWTEIPGQAGTSHCLQIRLFRLFKILYFFFTAVRARTLLKWDLHVAWTICVTRRTNNPNVANWKCFPVSLYLATLITRVLILDCQKCQICQFLGCFRMTIQLTGMNSWSRKVVSQFRSLFNCISIQQWFRWQGPP